jgi:uncharacterized membrane protein
MFIALTTVLTMVISIPVANTDGFINIGDSIIFICAVMLDPPSALLVGGLGSAFADLLLGYAHWAPFTFIIKGLEGLLCSILFHFLSKNNKIKFIFQIIVSTVIAAVWMIAGYFVVSIWFYGLNNAYLSMFPNVVQGGLSIVIAAIILMPFKKSGLIAYVEGLIYRRKADNNDINNQNNNNDNIN